MRLVAKIRRAVALAFSDPVEFRGALRRAVRRFFDPPTSGEILVNGIRFNIDLDLDSAMKQMYHGHYQVETTGVFERYLEEGDTFIDVGANVGYMTAFALGLVGKTGQVHSFEPVPQYFERLKEIKSNNTEYHLYVNNLALGETSGVSMIAVTDVRNIGWNTMVPGFARSDTVKEKVEVRVARLDDYLFSEDVHDVRLIKIDTEGYELPVLKGLEKYLSDSEERPVLVVEIAPAAYPKLNSSLGELMVFLALFGYEAKTLSGADSIDVSSLRNTTDVLFVPAFIA